jgi:hypothetical protein
MAYIDNGNWRAYTCQVTLKNADGTIVSGYPRTYSILDAFDTFPALTTTEFRQLSETDYLTRLNAFYTYIEGLNTDLEPAEDKVLTGHEAYGRDTIMCPLSS